LQIKKISSLIQALIESGLDEDAHFWGFKRDGLTINDIEKSIQDIEQLDQIMNNLRDSVIFSLKKVAQDYRREEYDF